MRAALFRLATTAANLAPEELALVLALGVVLGTFPVYGAPTMLCLAAAIVLRINAPALQLVNQLSSPLQIALFVPLARLGWRVSLPASAPIPLKLGAVALQAASGWCIVCIPLGIAFYFSTLYVLRRTPRAQWVAMLSQTWGATAGLEQERLPRSR